MSDKSLGDHFLRACHDGDEAKVHACITLGVNVNVTNTIGYTALHYAVMQKHPTVVDILLAHWLDDNPTPTHPNLTHWIDVNAIDKDTNMSALDRACSNGTTWAVTKLGSLLQLSGVNRQGHCGWTPLILAVIGGRYVRWQI